MSFDAKTLPIDAISAERLAANGLRLAVLDGADLAAFSRWFGAMERGFNQPRITAEELAARQEGFEHRRNVGVWDDSSADPETPVATAGAWIAELTVPGGVSIPSWAISTVTVSPTHRRRGIARNLLEAELRTASALGVPIAILTASEASIYSRYGFSPAAMAADWTIDVRQTSWIGPVPAGRVQLIESATLRDGGGHDLVERVRLGIPGQLQFAGLLWNRMFGVDPARIREIRVARYDDADGIAQGFAIYRVEEVGEVATLHLNYLVAATDDAYAALWRYLLEVDLVQVVLAHLRPVDEPFFWQLSNSRAARKSNEGDHLWLRILDVKTALEARVWSAPGRFVLAISDDLGLAAGVFLLDIAPDGSALVSAVDRPVDGSPTIAMSVNALSASYLGATSLATLVRAGRVTEVTDGAAALADAAFRSAATPWLSIWF